MNFQDLQALRTRYIINLGETEFELELLNKRTDELTSLRQKLFSELEHLENMILMYSNHNEYDSTSSELQTDYNDIDPTGPSS